MTKKRAMLIILDGCGEGKPEYGNAVYMAKTPCLDALKKDHAWSLVEPGGAAVGVLPWQTGGSDVGHNTIGSGRIVRQPVKIIFDAVEDKSFFKNKELITAINHAKKNNSNLHLFGIGSDSFIHSYTAFIYALLDLIKQENFPGDRVFLHLAADGRDNPPMSAIDFFEQIEIECEKRKIGKIASIIGRFYLDRGKAWDRTEKLYKLLTDPSQPYSVTPTSIVIPAQAGIQESEVVGWKRYLRESYSKNITDEFLEPIAFGNEKGIFPRISDNDAIINFCYRADRERQITEAITEDDFQGFSRTQLSNIYYVGFIPYSGDFKNAHAAFHEEQANVCMSELIDQAGLKQFHIAGKEKIIFVTYNLNRCEELHLPTETDGLAPQTHEVETFDKNPEMSAPNLTKILLEELEKNQQDVYVINYENCDQVGHTGNLEAAIKAVEAVEKSLSEVIPKALEHGFEILITADHGNADVMIDEHGNPHTAHSHNKVPAIFVSNKRKVKMRDGELSDIAPTFLEMLGLSKSSKMTGKSLISKDT